MYAEVMVVRGVILEVVRYGKRDKGHGRQGWDGSSRIVGRDGKEGQRQKGRDVAYPSGPKLSRIICGI